MPTFGQTQQLPGLSFWLLFATPFHLFFAAITLYDRMPSKQDNEWHECDFQVFLEPFSQVLGQAKSKQVLITVAQSDPSHMTCLHRFGILLGITDWVKDYQKKLNPLESQNGITYTSHLEQVKVRIQVRKTSIKMNQTGFRWDESIFYIYLHIYFKSLHFSVVS